METYDKKTPVCYVKVPSSCNDLVQKDSKYFSWEACGLTNGKYYCIACTIPHLIAFYHRVNTNINANM